MRRHRARSAAAAVLAAAALIVAPLSAASAADTVITSIDFEDGTTGDWIASGGGENTLSVVELDGSQVLQVADRADDYTGIQSPAGIFEAGTTYSVSARIKLAEGTADQSARFVMKPAYTWIGPTTATADDWTTISGEYTVADDADLPALQLYIGTGGAESGNFTYYLDDLVVTALDTEPTEPTDPTDPGTPPVVGPTALSNDFEEGLGGWVPRDSGSGAPTVTLTTDDAQQGNQSAALTGRTSQGSGFGHDIAELQANTTYEVTAWVRFGEGQATGPVWLSLQRDYQGATTFSTLAQFANVTNSGWTQVRASFPLQAFDTGLLYFETDYNGTNTSDLYFDDIQVSVPEPGEIQDLTPLQDTLDVPVGVAIDSRETTGVASELLLRHFDQITGENYMKPEAWYDANGQFRANPEAVALMDFAEANDLAVYGHVLVWHSQTPAFFFQAADGSPLTTSDADKQILRDRLREHIFNVAEWLATEYGEFGGTNPLNAWDVVNEVVSDGSEYADGLRRSEWYRILGEEFIDLSFQYADEAFNEVYAADGVDRPVTLFINDYNTEQSGKQGRYLALVERLLARGVPIDGVGHQFHVSLAMPVSALEQAIRTFADLPVTQVVTELDVTTGTPVSEALLIEQGYYYRDAFRVFRENIDELYSVTVWGLTDGRSWRSANGAPLLFDDAYQGKPAFFGAVDEELPARQRSAFVFGGSVPVDDAAPTAAEWDRLPLLPIEQSGAFQLRWEPGTLTAFVEVRDGSMDDADGVSFSVGDQEYVVGRDGEGDVTASVTETDTGYRIVAALPLGDAALGDVVRFDARIADGDASAGWNTAGELGNLTLVEPLSFVEVVEAIDAPTIDGAVDDAWAAANAVTTDRQVEGTGGATASVRTLWQDNTLFVLAEVADPVVDVSGSDPWIQDSVEIYVDAGNVKNGSYRYDDTQIRISAAGAVSFGTGDEAFQRNRVESQVATVDGGYVVEARISLLDSGGEGTFHGLDFQVNDASDGARTGIRNWADPTGAGYQSTARWGVGELVAAEGTTPTEPGGPTTPTEPGTPGEPGTPTTPPANGGPDGGASGDPRNPLASTGGGLPFGLGLAGLLALLAGAILVQRRRERMQG